MLVSSVTDTRLADTTLPQGGHYRSQLYRVADHHGAVPDLCRYGVTSIILGFDALYAGFLLVSVVGLVLVEQIMRNAHIESRRAVKYLCIGLGVIFAYDFYLYSNALLFQGLDVSAVGGARICECDGGAGAGHCHCP